MKTPIAALGLVLALTLAAATPAAAAGELAVQGASGAPDLGKTIKGSAATTFSISTGGTVTRTSGNAVRLSNGSVTTPTIRLTCALISLPNLCIVRYIQVTIQPVAGSGPASITKFRAGSLTSANFRDGPPVESSSLVFILDPMGVGTTTFKLGMDVVLAAAAASGATTFDYTVTAVFL